MFPYAGTVDAFNATDGTHCVTYADGTEEWLEARPRPGLALVSLRRADTSAPPQLGKEQLRLLLHAGEVPPPPPSAAVEAPAAEEVEAGAPTEEMAPLPEPEADAAGPALPEGMDAVGFRIAVFWPGDNTWCVP